MSRLTAVSHYLEHLNTGVNGMVFNLSINRKYLLNVSQSPGSYCTTSKGYFNTLYSAFTTLLNFITTILLPYRRFQDSLQLIGFQLFRITFVTLIIQSLESAHDISYVFLYNYEDQDFPPNEVSCDSHDYMKLFFTP